MSSEQDRKKIDIYVTLSIAYFFAINSSFIYFKLYENVENYILFTVVMIVAMISYYTNITLALIITLIIDFIYSSYKLYLTFVNGINIQSDVYYWIIAIAVTAIIFSNLSRLIVALQEESKILEKENQALVMIDAATGSRNAAAFFNEVPIYMSMSKRYNIPLTLMLVKFRYKDKLKAIVSEAQFNKLLIEVSNILKQSLRLEDRKYILKDRLIFAFLLISEGDGSEIVKQRFKENIEKINISDKDLFNKLKIEVEIGYYAYNAEISDAFDFLEKAEMELEYDV
ncbi:diguanylate cyclase domain-containing protein [Clostridium folliculivorans]|uniref:Diguanylate cyclase n=1 Tax=Clostridium folliculivorans TaxID=2886038 RepID=A0A9W5Y489_9CLOT|nr:diguanylate cyclase [Clostridium folliculivorans]GKU26172.1 diguanylate cyclase [Clostridium folliculivorans]GKU31844.1 diguanylate cyclase [Clostridium folliculivorans]